MMITCENLCYMFCSNSCQRRCTGTHYRVLQLKILMLAPNDHHNIVPETTHCQTILLRTQAETYKGYHKFHYKGNMWVWYANKNKSSSRLADTRTARARLSSTCYNGRSRQMQCYIVEKQFNNKYCKQTDVACVYFKLTCCK